MPTTSAPRPLTRDELIEQCTPGFLAALTAGNNGPLPPRNRTLGPTWVRFVHTKCVMGEGDLYGQPARMSPDQQALFWKVAELEDDGSRRFDFVLYTAGKGSGKTPVMAWIGKIDIASDCAVFKEWAPNGNPRGRARVNASVLVMAASEDQADLVHAEMRASFEADQAPMRGKALAMSKVIEMTDRKASAKRIAATAAAADGSKASTLLVDEVHECVSEEQEKAITVAEGGTGKRDDGLIIWGSTAGMDLGTLFGRRVADGRRGAFTRNQLFINLHAPEEWVKHPAPDDEMIAKGIRAANPLAAAGIASVRRLIGKFKSMPLFRAKRYYWNLWVPTDESWLPAGAWDACKGELVSDLDLPTWVGADMALKRDSAAVVKAQLRPDGKIQVTAKIWVPDGSLIDQTECDAYIRLIASTHSDLQWIAADEAWWPTLPELEKGDKEAGHPPLPIFRMPQQGRNMVIAYTHTYRRIVDQIIVHDGAPDFADQISSAVPNSSDRGWTLKKGRHKRRIDSCPALAGAMFASTLAPPEKEPVLQQPWVV